MDLHPSFGFQIADEFLQRRVRHLDYFIAQGRERLSRQRGRVAPGVRPGREAETGAAHLDEAGDGAPTDGEEFGHVVQSVFVTFISESNLLSKSVE
jgi:hypothetical protein